MIINHLDNQVSVEYVADEFGFHPVGSHIPVAPPMPPHVRCADYAFLKHFLQVVQFEFVLLETIQSFSRRLLDHLAKVNGLAKLY